MRLIRSVAVALTHDWKTARQVRTYWQVRLNAEGHGHFRDGDLPCLWCVHDTHDTGNNGEPVWLWCHNPKTGDTWTDHRGVVHALGCDWGNR